MSSSKTYLNVPYAEKDSAKALGAKWDVHVKKWYAPAGADIHVFAKWRDHAADGNPPAANGNAGVFTHPTVKDFAGYDGDMPPWD